MSQLCHYFVEGECEHKLFTVLKDSKNSYIKPGKVSVFNVQQELFTSLQLRTINVETMIVLVFDIDKPNIDILDENLSLLKKYGFNNINLIMQDKNLEDELVKAMNIKNIKELLPCGTNKEFKSYFISEKRLMEKLISHNFDINKMWQYKPDGIYVKYKNDSKKIKL